MTERNAFRNECLATVVFGDVREDVEGGGGDESMKLAHPLKLKRVGEDDEDGEVWNEAIGGVFDFLTTCK
jgi:hypothetical protein